jgi:hypothetical protein
MVVVVVDVIVVADADGAETTKRKTHVFRRRRGDDAAQRTEVGALDERQLARALCDEDDNDDQYMR